MKLNVEAVAKYAGLATVAIEWSALLIYYLEMPLQFGGKQPISYFATIPETRWAFTACYVFAAISFWIFVKHHLAKYYRIPLKIFGISLVLFAGVGLFPYDPNDSTSTFIHAALALLSGLLFVIGMFLIAIRTKDKLLSITTFVSCLTSTTLTIAFLLVSRDSRLVFSLEAGSWLVLQLWTIWLTFYIRKHRASLWQGQATDRPIVPRRGRLD